MKQPTGILLQGESGDLRFTPIPPKPILVIYLNATPQQRDMTQMTLPEALKEQYHVLVLFSMQNDVKVFFEKDQVELNQEMLEELLSIHKK